MSKPVDADPEWNDLRCLLWAARAGSLAGAARAQGVEHSTIGRRLNAVEEALGVALITRGAGGLTLTAIGEQVVPLVQEMERAALAIRELTASRKTRVRLATPSGFNRLIAPRLVAFQAQHPGLTLEVSSGSRKVDLKRSEADLAIRLGLSEDEDLVSRKLGDVGWSLYASAAYLARHPAPADPRKLAGHDLLVFDKELAAMPGARWLQQHGAGANPIMHCREVSDLLDACVAGLGLAVLPCGFAATESNLQRLTPEVLDSGRLSLVYRKEVLVAQPIQDVIRFVSELMTEYEPLLSGRA